MSGINIRVIETAKKLAQSLGLSVVGHLQKPFPLATAQELLRANIGPEKLADKRIRSDRSQSATRTCVGPSSATSLFIYYQPQINIATGRRDRR